MPIQSLTDAEIERLLSAARAYRKDVWLMLVLALNHGLRVSEVVDLTADNFRDGQLDVQRRKGSLRTIQPLIETRSGLRNERIAVFDLLRNRRGNQKLFGFGRRRADQLIKHVGALADIPHRKRHMHVLKHTLAMQTIHSAGIENVRQYLGHKSISSTGAYLKVSDEDAARAIGETLK